MFFKNVVKFKNFINVVYAFDNIYYYITHVSMKSIMINQHKNTYIIFHILVSDGIYNSQKPVIDDICQEYKNCRINYYILKDEFKEFSVSGIIRRTTAIYYRLMLQNLLINETKTLYFDCDTLIYKDLTELYNYNISEKYYIGKYEGKPLIKYGRNLSDFINSGAMLINLEKLRKDNIFPKMIDFLRKNNGRLFFLDQDAINVVCNSNNGFFPSNYISSGICNLDALHKINKAKSNLLVEQLKESYIFHFKKYKKPWHGIAKGKDKLICFDFFPRFYEFARKTKYYFIILEKFACFQN
jgi:lipopolysaccharide biosynthesis glycosyltransferase